MLHSAHLEAIFEWLRQAAHSRQVVGWGIALGILSLGGLFLLPYFIARLPVDYLTRSMPPDQGGGPKRVLVLCARNLLGAMLILLGLALLVLPGQGLLTVAIGIVVLDFPGKRRFERWFLGRTQVLRSVNALRRRLGQPPLD